MLLSARRVRETGFLGSHAELEDRAALMPMLEGKLAIGGKATAFVCEKGHCELPTSAPEVLRKQLAKVKPLQPDGGSR